MAGGAKSNVYTYYFTRAPADNREEGAYHGSEIWYTFYDIPYSDYSNVTWYDYDYVFERRMSGYWANFIRKGNPNGDGLPNFIKTTNQTKETVWLATLGELVLFLSRISTLTLLSAGMLH